MTRTLGVPLLLSLLLGGCGDHRAPRVESMPVTAVIVLEDPGACGAPRPRATDADHFPERPSPPSARTRRRVAALVRAGAQTHRVCSSADALGEVIAAVASGRPVVAVGPRVRTALAEVAAAGLEPEIGSRPCPADDAGGSREAQERRSGPRCE